MKEFVTLNLREKEYVFRALDLDQLEQMEPQFAIIGNTQITGFAPPKEFLDALATIARESLLFKQPDIELADVRKLLTLGTVDLVIEAIRGVSGLEPVQGEAKAA